MAVKKIKSHHLRMYGVTKNCYHRIITTVLQQLNLSELRSLLE